MLKIKTTKKFFDEIKATKVFYEKQQKSFKKIIFSEH